MDTVDTQYACGECGAEAGATAGCRRCVEVAEEEPARGLYVLPRATTESVELPPVRLVRELKLPTQDTLAGVEALAQMLPATVRSASAAIAEEDFGKADALLDSALGAVLAGPGHERREDAMRYPGRLALILLGSWCIVVLLVVMADLVLYWLGAGE